MDIVPVKNKAKSNTNAITTVNHNSTSTQDKLKHRINNENQWLSKNYMKKDSIFVAIVNVIILTVIIFVLTFLSMKKKVIVGPVMILSGIISLIPALFFDISLNLLKSDIIFGIIDNGLLIVFAIMGAELFGIFGAIIGSAIGNAITDALAGIFEGAEAQKIKEGTRTALSVAIGKLAGCLIGAGVALTIAWSILNF